MWSTRKRFALCLCLVAALAFVAPGGSALAQDAAAAGAGGADNKLAGAWEDFAHYVRVVQIDLANANGQVLVDADGQALLTVVEASRQARMVDNILDRARRTEQLKDIADKLIAKLETAKLERSREAQRIIDDIQRLGTGERAYQNAIVRLREAGQWTAPHILRALADEKQKALHPTIQRAMREIGLPLVYPLCVALNDLEPVTQVQVADVLQEIGYARALPYMLQALENKSTDPHARDSVKSAYDKLADRHAIPVDVKAADLFLLLGQNLYRTATHDPTKVPGYDQLEAKGIVWRYTSAAGLVPVRVPGQIYGDVLAMDAGRSALKLNNDMDQALSLWLAANLRRENRLPAGETDLTYPAAQWQPPAFYLQLAGPLRAHDVLARALQDQDPELALDAITALSAIAGTEQLVNRQGTIQPLLWALSYPDRRVRFHAAFALTNAKPQDTFEGAQRVVPVLAEALRQSEQRYAVVIAEKEVGGTINSVLRDDLGIHSDANTTLESLADQIAASSGADLLIIRASVDDTEKVLNQASLDYKLAAVPVIALVPSNQGIEANRRFQRQIEDHQVFVVPSDDTGITKDLLDANIKAAMAAYVGRPIEAEEAEQLALRALVLLREIALIRGNKVFRVLDAQPALTAALKDPREKVAEHAANVLSLFDNAEAQEAIATAALDDTRSEPLRVAMLGSLAESATYYGNHLTDLHVDRLLKVVKSTQGDIAVAASRAHGALTLPTANAVQLIVKD